MRYIAGMARRSVISERVLELMGDSGRHCWTIDDLKQDLTRRGHASDLSSVFRALSRLETEGQVVRVPIDDRRSHYEIARDHHEHLVCETCGAIEPVACSAVETLVEEVRATSGFAVSGHSVILTGTCAGCLDPVATRSPRGVR